MGGSIGIEGMTLKLPSLFIVLLTVPCWKPAIETISPAKADSSST
jgi:hypothetical protein